MDFKFGKELIKALYKIRDAINNKKNNGGEEQNNGGEGNDDMKLIEGNGFFFYDPKETVVPNLPSSFPEEPDVLSVVYDEEDINTIKDIFKRALDCLEYNEGFRKYLFEDNPSSDEAVIEIWSAICADNVFVSSGLSESTLTKYELSIANNSFRFILQTLPFGSSLATRLEIDFSNDYLFYDKTTGKYIWEIEGFDVDTLITGNTPIDVSFINYD